MNEEEKKKREEKGRMEDLIDFEGHNVS